jgi:acyl-CoA thioester hydrolase
MGEAPAPFAEYRTAVLAEWLDYNGHMNDSSYGIVLSAANERLLEELGLSAEYRARTGASLYTVETLIRYLAECTLGQTLRATSMLVDADAKKVRVYTELLHDDGRPAATGESLYLHVDSALGTVTPMPGDRHDRVQKMLAEHADLPRPARLGLGVAAPRPGRPAPDKEQSGV